MPIYEFVCEQCGHEFESFQRLSDPLPEQCPSCAGGPVIKKISAAGFRLKGGGWYETDFKSGAKKNVSGSDSKDAGGSGANSGGKSDAGASSGGSGSSGSSGSSSGSSGSSGSGTGTSAGTGSSGSSAKKD
ncbi:MAG: zinc ribbon domain-containing protein [Pseudomonadota bacterium]